MMRRAFLPLAFTALPLLAAAQGSTPPPAVEAGLEITLPAPAMRGTEAPAVRSVRMLSDRTTRELLFSGFPA